MDQRERYTDDAETFRIAMQAWQTRMWTALPGVIKQYPAASGTGPMTADVQPTINGRVRTITGVFQSIQMPLCLDCPILWQGGGGMTLTFPIQAGNECLIVFSSRCIDAWWQQGFIPGQAGVPVTGKQAMDPPDLRMHNLSDGFILVGVRSLPESFTPDPANVSLQTDDGSFFWKMNPTTKAISATAPGGINFNGVTIDSSGNLTSPATITGTTDVVGGGKHLKSHIHSGVSTGSNDSGPPV